jgi:hypothetical protein
MSGVILSAGCKQARRSHIKTADFWGFPGQRNKIAKSRLTESNTTHICPLTDAALTDYPAQSHRSPTRTDDRSPGESQGTIVVRLVCWMVL